MIHQEILDAVAGGDSKSLKYYFRDCLDGDPTFRSAEEDFAYCLSEGIPFEPHAELHPMTLEAVDEAYWVQLQNDFMQNPSAERLAHMREAAKILYSSRIARILEQEQASRPAPAPTAPAKPAPSKPTTQTQPTAKPQPSQKSAASAQTQTAAHKPAGTAAPQNGADPDGIIRTQEPQGQPQRIRKPKKAQGVSCWMIFSLFSILAAVMSLIIFLH